MWWHKQKYKLSLRLWNILVSGFLGYHTNPCLFGLNRVLVAVSHRHKQRECFPSRCNLDRNDFSSWTSYSCGVAWTCPWNSEKSLKIIEVMKNKQSREWEEWPTSTKEATISIRFHLSGFDIFGVGVVSLLTSILFLCSQKELREKQIEMVKTVTAAENAINKLQLNTVSIAVNATRLCEKRSMHVCHNISHMTVAAIFGMTNLPLVRLEVSDSPKTGRFPWGVGGHFNVPEYDCEPVKYCFTLLCHNVLWGTLLPTMW